jgi:hypothetical protein
LATDLSPNTRLPFGWVDYPLPTFRLIVPPCSKDRQRCTPSIYSVAAIGPSPLLYAGDIGHKSFASRNIFKTVEGTHLKKVSSNYPTARDDEITVGEVLDSDVTDPRAIPVAIFIKLELIGKWRSMILLVRQSMPTQWPHL